MRRTDSTESDKDALKAGFAKAVGALADGDLTFTPPFDLATSAALAANIDTGAIAQQLFEVTAQRDTGYRVEIYAVAPDVEDREILKTSVASTNLLIELLDGLLDEYLARQESNEEGDPSGG